MWDKQRTLNQASRKYDVPFDVLKRETVTDADKVKTNEWVPCNHLYAFMKKLYGKQYEEARHEDAKYTIVIITKFGPQIDDSMRIRLGSKIYDIENIDNIEMQNQEYEIRAVERVRK